MLRQGSADITSNRVEEHYDVTCLEVLLALPGLYAVTAHYL